MQLIINHAFEFRKSHRIQVTYFGTPALQSIVHAFASRKSHKIQATPRGTPASVISFWNVDLLDDCANRENKLAAVMPFDFKDE